MKVEDVDLRRIKSTLIINYCGRSGSYLLSNLMDGHSEILSCPPHSLNKVIENIMTIKFDIKNHTQIMTSDSIIEDIVKCQPFLFRDADHTVLTDDFEEELQLATECDERYERANHKKAPKISASPNSEIGVKKGKFREIAKILIEVHLKNYSEELTVSDIFSLIHWAYALGLNRKISTNNPIICFQRHTWIPQEYLRPIADSVINPIFVTTIRRFEDALDSHLQIMTPEFETQEETWRVLTTQFAYNLSKKHINLPQWAIKFEDMHVNTEELVRKLCQKLDMTFQPILLETTLDNQIYFFDSNGVPKTGTNKNLTRAQKFNNLSIPDIIFLNLLFCKHYQFYSYEFHPTTLDFVECDPTSLTSQDLISFLVEIERSGRSYLANLKTDILKQTPTLLQLVKQDFNPLELINPL